jgi:hypothetical protein
MTYTFLAVQVAVRDLSVRAQLYALLAGAPVEQSLADKRDFWSRAAAILGAAAWSFDFGYWDYISEPERAEREFDTWCSDIEKVVGTPVEGGPAQGVYRTGQAGGYCLVSLAFLLKQGGTSDVTATERCDIPEPHYFTRAAFAHLVATPPMLSFASVRADALYVVPGAAEDALTADELRGEGYEYLRALT